MEIYKELLSLSTPIIGMFALYIFQKMSDSVTKLNENVAVVINQVERQGSCQMKPPFLIALLTLTSCSSTVFVKDCKHLVSNVWECKE